MANALVWSAIQARILFSDYELSGWKREVPYAGRHRIDFLHSHNGVKLYVEVKSVTYAMDGIGLFPDAVSLRARQHLMALQQMHRDGHQTAVVYCVQRDDVSSVYPAKEIDANYAQEYALAEELGVQFLTLPIQFDDDGDVAIGHVHA